MNGKRILFIHPLLTALPFVDLPGWAGCMPVTHSHIRQPLDSMEGPTIVIWVPDCKGMPGNEAAGEHVKAAALPPTFRHDPPRKALWKQSSGAQLRLFQQKQQENSSWGADCKTSSTWAHAMHYARLRSKGTLLINVFAHLIDPAADPTCMEEPQTWGHWLHIYRNLDVLNEKFVLFSLLWQSR